MKITSYDDALVLAKATDELASLNKDISAILCPSPLHMYPLAQEKNLKHIHIGAQNIARAEAGAYTGETSVLSLGEMQSSFSIIGHSERRAMGETNDDVNAKLVLALKNGVQPIMCFGESERLDDVEHYHFIKNQLKECLVGIPVEALGSIIFAYEPIWAISSTENAKEATPSDIQEMAGFIHKTLADMYNVQKINSLRLCYGGSVNAQNIKEYRNISGISGFLVGSAGTKVESLRELFEGVLVNPKF